MTLNSQGMPLKDEHVMILDGMYQTIYEDIMYGLHVAIENCKPEDLQRLKFLKWRLQERIDRQIADGRWV